MKRAEVARLWARHMEGWKASGLTQRAYCERKSISYDTFKRWRLRLRGERGCGGPAVRLVPVSVGSAKAMRPQAVSGQAADGRGVARGVEVRLASGRSLVLGGEFDELGLARLIRLLEVLPC